MVNKIFCDRCGKEIKGIRIIVYFNERITGYDVCKYCLKKLKKFIDQEGDGR